MLPDNSLKVNEICPHDVTRYRKQGASFTITIPKSLRDVLTWKDGDMLFLTVHHSTMVIIPARLALTHGVSEYVKAADRPN